MKAISSSLLPGLAGALLWPLLTAAHESALPSEEDILGDVPVVLSVTRLAQTPAQAPAAVTIIDRELIEASGAREVPDLFRLVPGFQVGRESGHTATVAYHGLSDEFSRRLLVLVDGRAVYQAAAGNVDWRNVPVTVHDIERIEITRGPSAAAHGSNALLGVIDIVTRQSFKEPGTHLWSHLGDNGIRDTGLRQAGRLGAVGYSLAASFLADDGFDHRHDSQRTRSLTLHLDGRPNLTDLIEVELGYLEGPRQNGFPGDRTSLPFTIDTRSHYQRLRWSRTPDASQVLKLDLYHNYDGRDQVRQGLLVDPFRVDGAAERYDAELSHTLGDPERWRLVWGAGLRRDEMVGEVFFNDPDTQVKRHRRAFANLELRPVTALTINAGAMWEHTNLSGDDISPRLALNYDLDSRQTLRAGYSEAYRTPLLFEERADFQVPFRPFGAGVGPRIMVRSYVGEPNLQSERIRSREIGYVGRFPELALTLDLRLFHDQVSRLITTRGFLPSPAVWTNAGSATLQGIEGQLDWRPGPASRLALTGSFVDTDADDADVADSVPAHTWSLLGLVRLGGGWSLSGTYSRVGAMSWLGLGTPARAVPGYERLDLRLAYGFRHGATRGQIALVSQGLLDDYADFLLDPINPTRRNLFDGATFLALSLDL